MKPLHDIDRDSKVSLKHLELKFTSGEDIDIVNFKHIDGMVGVCYVGDDHPANWFHLYANTLVKPVK